MVLKPYQQVFQDHTGPFIFEFQYVKATDLSAKEFIKKLDEFFVVIPRDFQYSVEIRNKNFLRSEYFNVR